MKATFKMIALVAVCLCSVSAHAWRIYYQKGYPGTIVTVQKRGSDLSTDIIVVSQEDKIVNSRIDLYSYKGDDNFIPGLVTLALMTDLNYKFPQFQTSVVYSQSVSINVDWYLQLHSGSEVIETLMAHDSQNEDKWSVSFIPNSKEVTLSLIFKFLFGTKSYDGDVMYAAPGETLSASNPQIQLISSITESDQGGSEISLTNLTPGTEYTLVWDAYNETLSLENANIPESREVEIYEYQGSPVFFSADQSQATVINGIFSAEGLELSDLEYLLVPEFEKITDTGMEDSILDPSIYGQMQSVIAGNPERQVDGYYEPLEISASLSKGENDSDFDLIIPKLSCSGKYILKLKSVNPDITLSKTEIPVRIYPNIFNFYSLDNNSGKEWPININGIPVTLSDSGDYEINYPLESSNNESDPGKVWQEETLNVSKIFMPGLYLTGPNDKLYLWIDFSDIEESGDTEITSSVENELRRKLDSSKYQECDGSIDLSSLKQLIGASGVNRLHLVVSKNGVETPVNPETGESAQTLNINVGNFDMPTYVEIVETENSCPIYYNLSGLRIDNPGRGIFIRITGKKVKKIFR